MSNSTSAIPFILNMVQEKLASIVLPFYLILGIVNNTFCIIYFLQRGQRASSCAFYLLLAAITNMFAVIFGVTTNMLNTWIPLASTLMIYCKSRQYINHTLILIGRMFTVLASIDTYAITSSKQAFRMFSRQSIAIKCPLVVGFCCPLIAVHIAIMNTIVAGQCVMTGVYSIIFTIYQMLIAGIIPPLAMMIFSGLAYWNMKKIGVRHDEILHRTKQ
ncbi:unnamed protein product [Rotaria sp. Silwood2]|nr:unnamed protein product [Rotaria sp. Silwood2]CAF3912947.1 unnamed protein product [Rotaria sp. Silwood2]